MSRAESVGGGGGGGGGDPKYRVLPDISNRGLDLQIICDFLQYFQP